MNTWSDVSEFISARITTGGVYAKLRIDWDRMPITLEKARSINAVHEFPAVMD